MAHFESPLGNKTSRNQSQLMREISIPDEEQYSQERQFHQERNQEHQQEQSVNPLFRKRQTMPTLSESDLERFQEPQDQAQIEREIKEARKDKLSGKERLNEGAKRRIEILLNMTKVTQDVSIDGTIFVLQTLPSKFMREAIMVASEYDGTVQSPFEVRRQFLARSLISIGGVDFEQFIGSNSLDVKLEFIDELGEQLLNKLYSSYMSMVEKAKERYSIKTEAEAKEIVEDLKK